jgi:hypothetical protein
LNLRRFPHPLLKKMKRYFLKIAKQADFPNFRKISRFFAESLCSRLPNFAFAAFFYVRRRKTGRHRLAGFSVLPGKPADSKKAPPRYGEAPESSKLFN